MRLLNSLRMLFVLFFFFSRTLTAKKTQNSISIKFPYLAIVPIVFLSLTRSNGALFSVRDFFQFVLQWNDDFKSREIHEKYRKYFMSFYVCYETSLRGHKTKAPTKVLICILRTSSLIIHSFFDHHNALSKISSEMMMSQSELTKLTFLSFFEFLFSFVISTTVRRQSLNSPPLSIKIFFHSSWRKLKFCTFICLVGGLVIDAIWHKKIITSLNFCFIRLFILWKNANLCRVIKIV